MADAKKPERETIEDTPSLAGQDWDNVEAGVGVTELSAEDDVPLQDEDLDETLPDEDDDNAFQESDEALPDDAEERALRRNPGDTPGRFGDV